MNTTSIMINKYNIFRNLRCIVRYQSKHILSNMFGSELFSTWYRTELRVPYFQMYLLTSHFLLASALEVCSRWHAFRFSSRKSYLYVNITMTMPRLDGRCWLLLDYFQYDIYTSILCKQKLNEILKKIQFSCFIG